MGPQAWERKMKISNSRKQLWVCQGWKTEARAKTNAEQESEESKIRRVGKPANDLDFSRPLSPQVSQATLHIVSADPLCSMSPWI
jgi:hypothetical protein